MKALLLAVVLLLGSPVPQDSVKVPPVRVRYAVDATNGLAGRLKVEMKVENAPDELVVSIPVWAPGSYRLQNFWKNVEGMKAEIGGKEAAVVQVDDQTWKVTPGEVRTVTFSYGLKLVAKDYDQTWCDAIGPATFLYIKDHKNVPCSTTFKMPEGWTLATGLDEKDGVYSARDYDTFIDCPTMMGHIDSLEFEESGVKFQLPTVAPPPSPEDFGATFEGDTLEVSTVKAGGPAAGLLKTGHVIKGVDGVKVETFADLARRATRIYREQALELEVAPIVGPVQKLRLTLPARLDAKRMVEVHRKLVRESIALFRDKAPFDRYLFLIHLTNRQGGGGLEHLNSCHISIGYEGVKRDPYRLAGLDSHEFVHAWNVKLIRPFELGPFDYTKAVPSKHLWFCEGVTSYYGDIALVRSGIWTHDEYLGRLRDKIDQIQDQPDNTKRSIEDFAEKVWTRPTSFYYVKGEMLGALLDLKIRTVTENRKSFDDVMRLLYTTYVTGPEAQKKGPIGTGFPADGILKAINEVAGQDFTPFYAKYIRGSEELPYDEVFNAAGLAFATSSKKLMLGVPMKNGRVGEILEGSDADKAGFKRGDRLLEIGGRKVERDNQGELIQALEPDKGVKVKVKRGEDEIELTATPKWRETPEVTLTKAAKPGELQKIIIESWLAPTK